MNIRDKLGSTSSTPASLLQAHAAALLESNTNHDADAALQNIQALAQELDLRQQELERQNRTLQQTQSALQQVKERFATLFEHAPVAYLLLDHDGTVRQFNQRWPTLLGMDAELLCNTPFARWLLPEDAPIFLDYLPKLWSNEDQATPVLRIARSSAPPLPIRVDAALCHNPECEQQQLMLAVSDLSEVLSAAQQLADSQRRYREIFEGSRDGFVVIDPSRVRIIDANQAFCSLLGYSLEGLRALEEPRCLLGAEQDPGFGPLSPSTPPPGLRDATLVRRDGSTFPAEILLYPIWNNSNDAPPRLSYLWASVRDVSASKADRDALVASEERFRSYLRHAPYGVFVSDEQARFVEVNPAACFTTGYAEHELLGMSARELIAEPALRFARGLLEPLLRSGQAQGELECVHKNGELRQWNVSAIRIEQDRFLGFVEDVTPRRRSELAMLAAYQQLAASNQQLRATEQQLRATNLQLRDSEERFRQIYENMAVGVARLNLEQELEEANAAFCQMLGYSGKEIASMHLRDVSLPELVPANMRLQDRLSAGELDHYRLEKCFLHRDGHIVHGILDACLVRSADGKPSYCLGTVVDISKLKQAQAEREALQANLAQSDRLSSMGMLAAGVAHEINNPLAYVLYNIESIAEEMPKLTELMRRAHGALSAQLGPEQIRRLLGEEHTVFSSAEFDDVAERLREALEGTRRIRDITKSLSTFSRVERDDALPVSVNASAEHAIAMAYNEIKYRARLVKDFSPKLPPVLATEGKLAQVFLNLLINAAHAIDEGRVDRNEIRIRTWSQDGMVMAELSDTGSGIAAEHFDRIFEPFFTTKGGALGSGLGLSICRSIVNGFGGRISVESKLGEGSRFRISLPELPSDWAEQLEPAAADEAASQTAPSGRILVIDDELGVRKTIERLLKGLHEVVSCTSGAEGRALLEEDQGFDIIFCDLMMPHMSGMELHGWLRQHNPALAEQVVFITGGAFTPGSAEYLAKVGNLRLEKPFDFTAFKRMCSELVRAAYAKRN
ncbi:MAG: PAS domain S-box protein [Myxococcota bacterium]|jgi:PAS domain S-box-containing protein|nr:PAS domain S-box protein [Myxococcota bacterium]